MQVVYICAELYQISTGTPASRGPSAIAGFLVPVCYRTVVLSVTLVYCGQTVGRIKTKLGTQVGLGLGHTALDVDPALHPPKGHSPQLSAHNRCGQMAAWIKMPLDMEIGLGLGDFVSDGDPDPPSPKGGEALQIFGP